MENDHNWDRLHWRWLSSPNFEHIYGSHVVSQITVFDVFSFHFLGEVCISRVTYVCKVGNSLSTLPNDDTNEVKCNINSMAHKTSQNTIHDIIRVRWRVADLEANKRDLHCVRIQILKQTTTAAGF